MSEGGLLSDRQFRLSAAVLAYVVAGLHLFHPEYGVAQLIARLTMGAEVLLADPRPVAFFLSSVAILGGVLVVLAGGPEKPVYALGIAMMGVFLGGYFAWHFTGHGGFLPGREPLHHGLAPHETVISHLTSNPLAAGAVAAEVLLLAALAFLYSRAT